MTIFNKCNVDLETTQVLVLAIAIYTTHNHTIFQLSGFVRFND